MSYWQLGPASRIASNLVCSRTIVILPFPFPPRPMILRSVRCAFERFVFASRTSSTIIWRNTLVCHAVIRRWTRFVEKLRDFFFSLNRNEKSEQKLQWIMKPVIEGANIIRFHSRLIPKIESKFSLRFLDKTRNKHKTYPSQTNLYYCYCYRCYWGACFEGSLRLIVFFRFSRRYRRSLTITGAMLADVRAGRRGETRPTLQPP